ncbi:MAG: molybdopterin cofactor-binding domain-containing protein [Oligoflexales bacterium]
MSDIRSEQESIGQLNRRNFVKAGASTGAMLSFGFFMPDTLAFAKEKMLVQESKSYAPNAFVSISSDNKVSIFVKHLEMGQGVFTGLPTILAEELEVDLEKIEVKHAPADASLYNNLFWGPTQGTGGSTATANSWQQLLTAGATARELFIAAAAKKLQVNVQELYAEKGMVRKRNSQQALSYGSLIPIAKTLKAQKSVKLKNKSAYKLIGRDVTRLDGREKTNGKAQFALDIRRPKRITALIARPTHFGAKVKTFDAKETNKVSGVLGVYQVPTGVAVLAESFWAAKMGRDRLRVDWDLSQANQRSTSDIEQEYIDLLGKSGLKVDQHGKDIDLALKSADHVIERTYTVPYLAHAPLEPLNCTIEYSKNGARIWSGSQSQTLDQGVAAGILGLEPKQVEIETTLAGGSFGRRATPVADLVGEAAHILKAAKQLGRPIHLVYTREDDIQSGYYRPMFVHRVQLGLDKNGEITAWKHRIVGQSLLRNTPFAGMIKNGIDNTSVEGVEGLVYKIPNFYADLHSPDTKVPVLWWRSVGHTHTAFAVESIIDEAAVYAKKDPIEYRLARLGDNKRHINVLKEVAKQSGWKPGRGGKGKGYGVSVHKSFGSYVAQVVEVTVIKGKVKVDRVSCAVDCGVAVNPDIIKTQMEGGIGFALSAAFHQELNMEGGKVVQSNFHDFPLLKMSEMPEIDVYMIEGADKPSGVGEPGVPPLFPAIANAIGNATGKRIERFPIKDQLPAV